MHLNLNSAIAVRQQNSVNDLEHNKIKGDKYKMMLGQQHTWLQWRQRALLTAPIFCWVTYAFPWRWSTAWGSGMMKTLRIPPPFLGESWAWGWAFRWSSCTAAPAGHSQPGPALQGESQASRASLLLFTAQVNSQVPHKLKNGFFRKLFEDDFCPVYTALTSLYGT